MGLIPACVQWHCPLGGAQCWVSGPPPSSCRTCRGEPAPGCVETHPAHSTAPKPAADLLLTPSHLPTLIPAATRCRLIAGMCTRACCMPSRTGAPCRRTWSVWRTRRRCGTSCRRWGWWRLWATAPSCPGAPCTLLCCVPPGPPVPAGLLCPLLPPVAPCARPLAPSDAPVSLAAGRAAPATSPCLPAKLSPSAPQTHWQPRCSCPTVAPCGGWASGAPGCWAAVHAGCWAALLAGIAFPWWCRGCAPGPTLCCAVPCRRGVTLIVGGGFHGARPML